MTNCRIIPPYLLQALVESRSHGVADCARRTLALDHTHRAGRLARPPTATQAAGPSGEGDGTVEPTGRPNRQIHDAAQTETLPGTLVRSEGDAAGDDTAVTEAYDGLGEVWTFWWEVFDRDSLDGAGLPLVASVHYGRDYDNAFWNGEQMVFGDGDGEIFLGFTRSIDVIGHELAHGVTQYTSNLTYSGQSGALNESISDVFGVLVKQHTLGQTADQADWLIGADLLAPGVQGTALRSMAAPGTAYDDPRLGKDPQPDSMAGYVETSDDDGGVHINSGIPNRAFHLVATALGGHAWEAAGQIWWDTVTGEIPTDCDFASFARLTLAAAITRYGEGSREATAVADAWRTVGVSDDAAPGPSDPVPPPDRRLVVRRTGGVAGMALQREVAWDALPDDDRARWQALLTSPQLRAAADAPNRPDAFRYRVTCSDPEVDLDVAEHALPEETRKLFDRTLRG